LTNDDDGTDARVERQQVPFVLEQNGDLGADGSGDDAVGLGINLARIVGRSNCPNRNIWV
jgi:hypothetical protein